MGLDLPALEDLAAEAFPLCLRESISESALPADLAEVEVSLVTAAEIARLHDEFMDDPSPTDVITFHHGEILISPETAQQQRRPHGHSLPARSRTLSDPRPASSGWSRRYHGCREQSC